jgi:predicted transcriptional regulator
MATARRQSEAERKALAHPVRTRLLDAIQTNGPATLSQLAHSEVELRSGVRERFPCSVLAYHLHVLRRVGLVRREDRAEGAVYTI